MNHARVVCLTMSWAMSNPPMPWQLMTDAAAHLGVSIRTLQRRIVAGELPSRKDHRGRVEVQLPMEALPPEVAATHALQTQAAAHEHHAVALAQQVEAMTVLMESSQAHHRAMVEDIRADARLQVRTWQVAASVAVVAAVVLGAVSIRNGSAGVTFGQTRDTIVMAAPDVTQRGRQSVVVDDAWLGVPFAYPD